MLGLLCIFCTLTILERWGWRAVVTYLRIGYARLCRPRRVIGKRDASIQCTIGEDVTMAEDDDDEYEDGEGLPP